jgi:fimbrial chaperone protein
LAAAAPCRAQLIELQPVRIDFDRTHTARAFTIVNRADKPATVQIRAFAWSQSADGADVLTPTGDLMLSPPFAELAPGESQVVRVRFTGAPQPAEGAYRLVVDQLPVRAASGIRMALRLTMPVFIAPLAAARPRIAWQWSQDGRGGAILTVSNTGGEHAMMSDIKITTASGAPLTLPASGSAYMLNGAVRRWRLAAPPGPASRSPLQVAAGP